MSNLLAHWEIDHTHVSTVIVARVEGEKATLGPEAGDDLNEMTYCA